ncbi:hypothetical protein GCM10020295_03910 [Streptomyces cinereospinus]
MAAYARSLRANGVPVPEIARKLVITPGKNQDKRPSVATVSTHCPIDAYLGHTPRRTADSRTTSQCARGSPRRLVCDVPAGRRFWARHARIGNGVFGCAGPGGR